MSAIAGTGGFEVRVRWQSRLAEHTDTIHVALHSTPAIATARAVAASEAGFAPLPDVRPPARDAALCLRAPASTGRWRRGRFYDAGTVARTLAVPALPTRRPLRCVQMAGDEVVLDGNHPLSGRSVHLLARGVEADGNERARLSAALSRLLAGAGMQAPLDEADTDFCDEDGAEREDDGPDRQFYSPPRLVMHLDTAALEVLTALHGRLLPPAARLLDLMASWRSPLPARLAPRALVGLGMNEIELAQNHRLTGRVVHDLNRRPVLPFARDSFDGVLCSMSVDYLCRPGDVFADLARVVSAGGPVVVTFSDRCFPTKVVRLWRRLYEFERLALVLGWMRDAGFADLHSWSLRGLPRPAGDRHGGNSMASDPVYAVWGRAPGC